MVPVAFALVVSVFAFASSTSSRVLGVSDDRQHLYEPYSIDGSKKSFWNCLSDPSIVLTFDQINDDYCDCPDGSDEPGTNACPYIPGRNFYCANEGYFPLYIESFKLNDGVCDYQVCCDGSDEFKTGLCPDKCTEINRQFMEYESNTRKEIVKSLEAKNHILAIASQAASEVENRLALVRQHIEEAELKFTQIEQSAQDNGDSTSSALKEMLAKLNEIQNVFGEFDSVWTAQESRIHEMESILLLLTENYNPNFNDQAVKSAVRQFQEYDSNKAQSGLANTDSLKNRVSAMISSASKIVFEHPCLLTKDGKQTTSFISGLKRVLLEYFFGMPPPIKRDTISTSDTISEELRKINDALTALKSNANNLRQDLAKDYGPNNILRGLQKQHVDGDLGGYNYHIELTGGVYQDSTFLGKFESFHDNKLHYEHGSKCWNGPHRSAVVELVCGLEPRIISISEPEKCEYLIQLANPIACENFTQQELLQSFKVDYSKL